MIFKAISKTIPLGSCFVCIDIGGSKRLNMQNLQTSNTAETRIIPKWLLLSTPLLRQQVYLRPSRYCTGCSHLRENIKATD